MASKALKGGGIKVISEKDRGDALQAESKGFKKGKSAYGLKTGKKLMVKK